MLLLCGIVYDLRADVGGCSDMHFHTKLKSLNQSVVADLKVSPDFIRDSLMAVPTFSHTKKILKNPIIFLSVYAVYNNDVSVCRCYLET
jgi:hypothetical protein